MQSISKIRSNSKPGGTPYQVPLKVQVAAVAATHRYMKDGVQKSVTEVGLADATGVLKAVCWDESKLVLLTENSTVLMRNFIMREHNLQITSTTKISKSQGLGVIPEAVMTQARDLVIFRPPPVLTICEAKLVPVGQLTSFAGKVILDEGKVNRTKNNGEVVVVRSVKLQDRTGSAKVSLWGPMADLPTPVSAYIIMKSIKVNNVYRGEVTFNSTSRTEIEETVEPPQECQIIVDGYYEEEDNLILVCKLDSEEYDDFYCTEAVLREEVCPGGEDVLDVKDALEAQLPLSANISYSQEHGKKIITTMV